MEINENTYDLINRYLNGELTGKELQDFEQQIESIPELRDEVKMHKELFAFANDEPLEIEETDEDLTEFMKSKEALDFKQQLEDNLRKHKASESKEEKIIPTKKMNWKFLALAGLLLLLLAFFWFNNTKVNETLDAGELFASYTEDYEPLALVTKGSNDDVIANIEQLFNNKNYREASENLSTLLDTLSSSHSNWFDLKLAQGITAMELDNDELAASIFNELANSEFISAPKAKWYEILLLLKKKDINTAQQKAKAYLDADGTYRKADFLKILNL